ncbi:MAG: hypothetical protein U0572_14700 [Phycisphaerales bacterium]
MSADHEHPVGHGLTVEHVSADGVDAFLTSMSQWSIAVIFLALAAWFLYESPRGTVPRPAAATIAKSDIAPGARRTPTTDPPTVVAGGVALRCNECHRMFESPTVQHVPMFQHTHIALSHGMNDSCFNCHGRKDREKLVLNSGSLIPFSESARLCAQCHGTVYRDWQRGTHGKTLGSWDASSGKQVRLACNQCHDPHAPAYARLVPLPPPNTLRMGDQPSEVEHEGHRHMPLLQGAERAREPRHGEDESHDNPESPRESAPNAVPAGGEHP